jgi:hypothetical protein
MTLSFLLLAVLLCGQTTIDWGVKSGLNVAQHYGTKVADMDISVRSGMVAGNISGVFLDLNILPNLALSYELLYSMKGSTQEVVIKNLDGEALVRPAVMNVDYRIDYIELPVLLKIGVFSGAKWKLNAITGSAMSLKVDGKHTLNGKIYFPEGDTYTVFEVHEQSKLAYLNGFDYSFVYGGSIEYSSKYDLFLEYRFTLGWDYLRLPTYSDFEPVELRNQTYSIMAGLRF